MTDKQMYKCKDVQKTGASKWSYLTFLKMILRTECTGKQARFQPALLIPKCQVTEITIFSAIRQTWQKALNQLPLNQLSRWTNELHSPCMINPTDWRTRDLPHQQPPSGAQRASLLPSAEHICSKTSFDPKPVYAVIF